MLKTAARCSQGRKILEEKWTIKAIAFRRKSYLEGPINRKKDHMRLFVSPEATEDLRILPNAFIK